jgi:hypothetical protein
MQWSLYAHPVLNQLVLFDKSLIMFSTGGTRKEGPMYGALHSDGTVEELLNVESASIEDDEVVCRDHHDRVVARYRISEALFGKYDALLRLAPYFRSYTHQESRQESSV